MAFTNSSLVAYTKISPNRGNTIDNKRIYERTKSIDIITPHCVVGQCSIERLGEIFAPTSRQASSNYGIGVDGRVGMYVEEKDRSWCSSSGSNDNRAVTIECASDTTAPYAMNDKVYATLIELCVDICKRNGKSKLIWLGDKDKTLAYSPKSDEMLITVHRWFANKSCPGDWLYQRLSDLASKVTEKLSKSTTNNGNSHINENMTTQALYKVQCGAFTVKANATALQTKLKAKGFDTYMVQVGKYYKVQVGAYSVKANAEAMLKKLQAAGYSDAFITYTGSSENVSSSSEIKVGDKVKVLKATTYAGKPFKLYYSKYDVLEVNGDRVVIGIGKTVTAAVHKDNLQKV